MYIIKLKITGQNAPLNNLLYYVGYYLQLLYKNNQIISEELQ
jgi:hypothetical protein